MGSKMQLPELRCMDPENYKKYFQALCWSGTRKNERPFKRRTKKDRHRRPKALNVAAVCYAPALLGNPSQFAVFATVRRSVLARWKYLQGALSENSDDSDDDYTPVAPAKIPKITGIGLRTVFSLVAQSRTADSQFCERALHALLDVLQGHAPEELAHEPTEIVTHMHSMLIEVAAGSAPLERLEMPTTLTALGTSCLISLVVARGEAELILNAVASLIMSPQPLSEQYIQIPVNLTTLQRSVQSVILGTPSRNQWLNYGVPQQSLVTSFPVDLPSALTVGAELVVRALVSDGCFLYVFTSRGLLKIGSGYGSSIKQHVYLYKPDFFPSDRHGWLGFCKNKLYVRIGRKKNEVYEVDKDSLEIRNMIKLDPGIPNPAEPKSAIFTDGHQLGVIMLTNNNEFLSIRFFDVEKAPEPVDGDGVTLKNRKELNVPLLRKRNLALGRASYEDCVSRRGLDNDAPLAMQLDDNEDDPLASICSGLDFGLLATVSGKVYYTGKGASLGYKAAPHCGRWTLMKETLFNKNDVPNLRKFKVTQVAVGHEGVHAILVLDNGAALFTGVARRGEDGDNSKHRRALKPTRPKKMYKTDGHHVVYAACNYGSTALVTRLGELLMFGKDTQHCDANGVVVALRQEKVTQVALGKAHAVVLTNLGQVYTFGINNKGQCGREFGYTKEKHYPVPQAEEDSAEDVQICQESHSWFTEYCRVCVQCRECTGFASACNLAHMPARVPGERCGCGEGDSGCRECGICRQCAEGFITAARPEPAEAMEACDAEEEERESAGDDTKSEKEAKSESQASGSDVERDSALKVSCLRPARIAIPGGHKITAVACGLHHTMLLTDHGEVLTFGSNQFGQLGAGDITPHHKFVKVKIPKAASIAAGSNHSAVMTRDGEVYTFGNYQKGSLGRAMEPEPAGGSREPVWYATPAPVPRIGAKHAAKAVWLGASGDQTFIQVCHSVIKTDTLFSSTIIANSTTIIILPNRSEHSFKCVTINKNDSVCNAWTGAEQVDFVNTLACLDPLYDVIWCYRPQMRVMKCYNILAFDSHKLQRCCNPDLDPSENVEFCYPSVGSMRRLEDFKNMENFELLCNNSELRLDSIALANMSILNQELAIPLIHGARVTRMHAAMHLLGCLDSLIYVNDNKLYIIECKREAIASPIAPLKADWLTVTRFENHGGGWGYSGHSVEAIRFMCDTDILLGGYGMFGGRGDYTAKIKLFDIGHEGGDQEGDGELIAESDEVVYECAPRDRFPVMFDSPIPVVACRWYVAWACINGPSSDCGSAGQAMVISDDVGFHFKTSKKSNNGTDINAGQIPSLLYNLAGSDHNIPPRIIDVGEPIITLTKNLSRKVTVPCFKSLIVLLTWSWDSFRDIILETNGLIPINYQKLNTMKHQKRLVYVVRACLRLVKAYVNEVYPQYSKKRSSHEYMAYLEPIGEVKNLIQSIVAEETPTCAMLPRRSTRGKANRVCYVQFALELTTSILKEAHETTTACFHAFFPTPTLKWSHLCSMLLHVKNGKVPSRHIRELTSTCAALCASRSLRDVLNYIVPATQCYLMNEDNKRPDSKVSAKEVPSKSATVPRSAHAQKPPPIPPRANQKDNAKASTSNEKRSDHSEWNIIDVIPKLLDIVMIPIKRQMMTRQCGQPHDHGEMRQNETLADFCCKLIVRMVAELSWSANNVKDMESATIKEMLTPSRFMRVNQSRSWNTGNGSPDAICFTVDRPGVVLVGVGVYSGSGTYEYSLELLHDMRQINGPSDEASTSNCWVSIDIVQGTFDGADCPNDMALIKFEKHVHLKEDLRYAIRFCNHGTRTSNGDCGLPSVKGPDGTTFRFASCSLSFNGTTLARGQIPCLIYCGTAARSFVHTVDTTDAMIAALHTITLRVSSLVLERSVDLFRTLRNELTAEDLRRNASVLQHSPAVNTLIPYVLANLEGIDDSKNIIKLLELIHQLLPHVTAMNSLVSNVEEFSTTTTSYYTWVESDHPYKPASINNTRVLFPPNISWIVLEMDPRSVTAQPEDTLTIYAVAGTPKQRCHCQNDIRVADPPFRKKVVQLSPEGEFEEMDEEENENTCMHFNCTYVSVTPKLANLAHEWPQKALLIPGNEVIFALETASDYLSEYNKAQSEESRFGFKCLCAGYEDIPFTSQRQGLVALEMELVYSGANCASKLLAPDLDVPPMVFSTLVDVQIRPMNGAADEEQDSSEALLLSRGLELSSPLSVHQVLDGQSLLRCVSTERQFLMDFIAGAESTAGGRLACWLAPTPRVDPSKCEILGPSTPAHPGQKVSLPILIRDQYGDIVVSPSLKVEVVIQKQEESSARQSRTNYTDYHISIPEQAFQPPMKDNMFYQAISMMRTFTCYSFEELRLTSGIWGDAVTVIKERVPAERLVIKPTADGSYIVSWTPKLPGVYIFRCTLDNLAISQELKVEVTESPSEGASERSLQTLYSSPPAKIARFSIDYSAGLRVRASPSLQAEELGRVDNDSNLAYVEELTNKDGTWVRLSPQSVRTYTQSTASVAWCLKYHRHLDKTLLGSLSLSAPPLQMQSKARDASRDRKEKSPAYPPPPPAPTHRLPVEPLEPEPGPSHDPMMVDENSFPFPVDMGVDDDASGRSPYPFGPEPSKRDRHMRNEAGGSGSQARRRSNGNEWWAPVRHRPDNGREVEPIPEADMESESDIDSEPEQLHDMKLYRDMHRPAGGADAHRRAPSAPVLPRWLRACPDGKPLAPLRRPHCMDIAPAPGPAPVAAPLSRSPSPPLLVAIGGKPEPPPKPKRPRPEPAARYRDPPPIPAHRPPVNMPDVPQRALPDEPPQDQEIQSDLEHSDKDEMEIGEIEDAAAEASQEDKQVSLSPSSQDESDECSMRRHVQVVSVEVHASGSGCRVAAGTQTSPDDVTNVYSPAEESHEPESRLQSLVLIKRLAALRDRSRSPPRSSPPPLPARTAPAPPPPPPKKHALSPAQAECLRAIFAALLWHEGIVHDAIACAAFLKFHPQLPKQGAQVVTRPPQDVSTARIQRHSVEVSNAGNYLRIQPPTLESLTRSGMEASTSRAPPTEEVSDPIGEEDSQANACGPSTSSSRATVNVLPPAMRALVALWDSLYDSDQLSAATDKYKQPVEEVQLDPPKVVDELACFTSRGPPRIEWKTRFAQQSSYAARCELCGGASVAPPLAAHMRHEHPGCRAASARGYDRSGIYKRTDPPPDPAPTDMPPSTCGQLVQETSPVYRLWYIFCERCRDRGIKASSAKRTKTEAVSNSANNSELSSAVDHNVMKENAIFLLDLAPLTNAESNGAWREGSGRNPPSPPASLWRPAPPFQCLPALGAGPRPLATTDAARSHSLGRPAPQPAAPSDIPYGRSRAIGAAPRVHRSISMGQAGDRDLANAALPPLTPDIEEDQRDTLSGAGSSLLAQPSAELLRLVGCGETGGVGSNTVSAFEPPRVDSESLMKSPVLSFVLTQRDLPAYRQKLDAAVRISTVRQYAFEAMNWLMRSTTQPTGVHDVMWWFCAALDKYARLVPPPNENDDNKERGGGRTGVPTAYSSALCPGGRSARGARAAFHALLGSVSALAPALPPASAAALQAVRCWALHYSQHDRNFLHRSEVFSVIGKILSRSEEMMYGEGFMGPFNESYHSFIYKDNFVWACADVTAWCDIGVSSRQGMAGCLIDGSTETFWESGDEDRNKAKWIQIGFPGGTPEERPHIVCVHIDNTRDIANKILLVSFLYSAGSGEMYHMQDIEVDPKAAAWVCYTLPTRHPGATSASVRVRCELRGPEPAVRVRQVRVLSAPALTPRTPAAPSAPLDRLAETDTLRVFRLLTSQVFGKLLEWEPSSGEAAEGAPRDDAPADDSDLREHVVGILFAGHQLTSLQRQVMSHIVFAIGGEAARVRDDWETAFLCADPAERDDGLPLMPEVHQQDNYCFEMLSLLLALSGSRVGRAHLAQQTELPADLLALLHTGSERVQRQVIFLLRRMMMEIPPPRMTAAINSRIDERLTPLDYLLSYLGKAIEVRVKAGGPGAPAAGSATMGSRVVVPGDGAAWFMRGLTAKKHARLVLDLISDMAEDKVSAAWGEETRAALSQYVARLAHVSEADRDPARCVALPTMWMALAALCVCEQAHVEPSSGTEGHTRPEPQPSCANHDDGTTAAVVECGSCGALCAECDRFLHLNRTARGHRRRIREEEEGAIRVDIHEGCGRAKLFWLLLLVDRKTLKGLAEFRGQERAGTCEAVARAPGAAAAGVCRFCGAQGDAGLLAIGNVCADRQCQDHGAQACARWLRCGHACGGVRGELECLPCLAGCAGALRQDADDMCMICFTDPLRAAPSVQLGCGHVFHLHCCKKVIASRWNGPRITFSFSQCPICKENMSHWTLEELLAPIKRLREEVQRKALMRFEYEGLSAPAAASAGFDPATYAMERYAYYVCHKCEKAYFGGLARCEAESNGAWEPSELICGACSDVAGAHTCPKHAADFLEYKCRYCCSVAVFFCFGTTHFCNACHDDFQRVTNIPRHQLPRCPAGPKAEQLPGSAEECPLHVSHPPTGEEFALGCGVCRHAQVF